MQLERPTRGSVPRAAWATAEVTFLSSAAHVAAGGGLPTVGWLVALGLPVFGIGLLFLQHRLGLRSALAAALAGKFALHSAMVQLAATPGHSHHPASWTPSMLVAHAVAALAIVAALAVRRRAWLVIARWPERELPPTPRPIAAPAPHRRTQTRVWLLSGPLRGPPQALACSSAVA